MSDSDLDQFERYAKQRLNEFLNPELKRKPAPAPSPAAKGWTVTLAVRRKRLEMDTEFVHHSTSISKLQATLEAEQAARAAGWPIVGFVVDASIAR